MAYYSAVSEHDPKKRSPGDHLVDHAPGASGTAGQMREGKVTGVEQKEVVEWQQSLHAVE